MKKNVIKLRLLTMAAAILLLAGCSNNNDFMENKPTAKGVMLTVVAGTDKLALPGDKPKTGTRATLTESDDEENPWKWEANDKLLVVDDKGNPLDVLTLKEGENSAKGRFEGTIKGIKAGQALRFFYLGPNTSKDCIKNGKIDFDFTKNTTYTRNELKNYCALSGTASVMVSGDHAFVNDEVELKNAFAVAHFSVKGENNSTLGNTYNLLAMHGKNVFLTASVDAATGKASGESPTSPYRLATHQNAHTKYNLMFAPTALTSSPYDVYMPLVPGETIIMFDIYTSNSYSDDLVDNPVEPMKGATAANSFVQPVGKPYSKFTVDSKGTQVYFTKGNLQSYLPIQLYSYKIKKNVEAGKLYHTGKDKAISVTCKYTVQKGSYRFAPNQWDVVEPTDYTDPKGYFGEWSCVKGQDGKWYVSGERNPYFDMFFFGDPEHPAAVDTDKGKYFDPAPYTKYQGTDKDWGTTYVQVDRKPTFTLTWDQWEYLLQKRKFENAGLDRPVTTAWLDLNENGTLERTEDIPGLVIFPDGMIRDKAKSFFYNPSLLIFRTQWSFDTDIDAAKHLMKPEAVTKEGCVFLPYTGWNNGHKTSGKKEICKTEQNYRHFNYWASSSRLLKIVAHINITMGGVVSYRGDLWDYPSGNAVRLVQKVNP